MPIGLVLSAPQAIGDADAVDLFVFPAKGHKCVKSTGKVDSIPKDAKKFALSNKDCGEGLSWCGEIELEKTKSPEMFAAIARSQGKDTLQGCTTAAVDQDPLEVTIEMQQIIEPSCCGDGKVQVGELCDLGGLAECGSNKEDEGCFSDCQATEVLLSNDGEALQKKPYLTNQVGTKSELSLAFCSGNEQVKQGLRAVFRSTDTKANGGSDINLRVLSEDVYSLILPDPLTVQLRLPVTCTMYYGPAADAIQQQPSIAWVEQDSTLMAYASDEAAAGTSDIFLVVHTEDVCADVPMGSEAATQISITGTAPGAITPDVARGPDGQALIVWDQQGQIVGRIWTKGVLSPGAADPPIMIGSGAAPKVAGSPSGWVVVYQGGGGDGDIIRRPVGLDGKPQTEAVVNVETTGPQSQPDVAMLDDATYAVVWQSGGEIFFQRFDQSHNPLGQDQAEKLNNDLGPGPHAAPAIGAPVSGGAFFAAAWENVDGSISARFIGKETTFLFNNVDGKNGAFSASHPLITGTRRRPAVAVGKYVAFGWEDSSVGHSGVFVRRFPLPQ